MRNSEIKLLTAKVFKSGNSMAIRIPSEIKLDAKAYEIEDLGDGGFCLTPIETPSRSSLPLK